MQKTTNKAPWVKCTYRAENGIVNGYGVSVDLGDGNMPIFIKNAEAMCHSEELDETRIFCSLEITAYKTLAGFYPRVVDVRVRELYRLHYSEKAFKCMCLRMGWHAKEN